MPFYGFNLYDMQFNKDETRVKLALTLCWYSRTSTATLVDCSCPLPPSPSRPRRRWHSAGSTQTTREGSFCSCYRLPPLGFDGDASSDIF